MHVWLVEIKGEIINVLAPVVSDAHVVQPRPIGAVGPVYGLEGHMFVKKDFSELSYIEFSVDGDFRAGGRHHVPVWVLARHGAGGRKEIGEMEDIGGDIGYMVKDRKETL